MNTALDEIMSKLPARELDESVERNMQALLELLPEKRLRRNAKLMVKGILGGQTPVVTGIAQSVAHTEADNWAMAKRGYRFLNNERFSHRSLRKGLYRQAQQVVAEEQPDYLVIAIDPVNFEKPYTHELEGVSVVRKSTPPNLQGQARLTRGYPAITATVVNTRIPVTSYANWFSYQTADFLSENKEIYHAIRTSHSLFAEQDIRFVGDAGLDDQKIFAWLGSFERQFIIRATHLERIIEVYNDRLDRWERETLQDLVDSVPFEASFEVAFNHAGRVRLATVQLGWFKIRLPDTQQALWVIVAEERLKERTLVLLTNIPLEKLSKVQQLYADWRLRGHIEHGYRFDQEQGLDVEDMRVRSLERMRRLFMLVLVAAQLVFAIMHQWPAKAVLWLRQLGGKLGLSSDRDGPYILLRGLSAVFQTISTLSFLAIHPFPHQEFNCG